MATKKISQLTTGTTANASDKLPIERSGANFYITPAMIWTYIQALTGNMAATARTAVRKNSTGSVFERRRLNLIEGSNVTLTVADDSGNEEVDITIAASGGGGGYTQGASVYHSSSQSFTSGAAAFLAFNSENYDTDTMHNTVTNNSRLTITTNGVYLFTFYGYFSSNSTGRRYAALIGNGADYLVTDTRTAISGSLTGLHFSFIGAFVATDYVQVEAFQDSGGSLSIDTGAYFAAQRIG